jgi:hypothetical protein
MSNNLGKFFSDNYLLIIIAIVVVVVMFYPKLSEGFKCNQACREKNKERKCTNICKLWNSCIKRKDKDICIKNCENVCKQNSSAYPKKPQPVTPPPLTSTLISTQPPQISPPQISPQTSDSNNSTQDSIESEESTI